ncbi:alpha/beta fold hydrolase [Deinococcus saxicola]|uniref:alpha/beta fold hydrolase n=1 Tax=Deinococcus saxicola TaxID=249406 RepID=UPI0039EF05CC
MYLRLAHLLAQNYTVWLHDPPGQGLLQGRWNDMVSVEQLTDHLALWLEAQQIRHPVLLGHSYGFRLFRVEIGTAPISTLHVRNPFFSFSLPSDCQVFLTPFNRSPYHSEGKWSLSLPCVIPSSPDH